MNNYEQKCLEADKELAQLLGWTEIELVDYSPDSEEYSPDGILMGTNPKGFSLLDIPRWTQDDAEAFKLACEHYIYVETSLDYWDGVGDDCKRMEYAYDSLSHKMQSIRYTIVQAVINKLKDNR